MPAVEGAQDLPVVPHKEKPFVFLSFSFERAAVLQFFGTRWLQATVIPGEFHRRHLAARGEVIVDDRSERIGLVVAIGRTCLHADWGLEFQHAEDGVVTVGAHVAKSATTEIAPPTPDEGGVSMVVRARGCGAEPQI